MRWFSTAPNLLSLRFILPPSPFHITLNRRAARRIPFPLRFRFVSNFTGSWKRSSQRTLLRVHVSVSCFFFSLTPTPDGVSDSLQAGGISFVGRRTSPEGNNSSVDVQGV